MNYNNLTIILTALSKVRNNRLTGQKLFLKFSKVTQQEIALSQNLMWARADGYSLRVARSAWWPQNSH